MSASVSTTGAPCRPLWIALVTWKNGSSPLMMRQSATRPRSLKQRHHRAEQLGDAAAVRGRVQVQNACAAQRPRGLGDRVQEVVGSQAPVRRERRRADVYAVQHRQNMGPRAGVVGAVRPLQGSPYTPANPTARCSSRIAGTRVATPESVPEGRRGGSFSRRRFERATASSCRSRCRAWAPGRIRRCRPSASRSPAKSCSRESTRTGGTTSAWARR